MWARGRQSEGLAMLPLEVVVVGAGLGDAYRNRSHSGGRNKHTFVMHVRLSCRVRWCFLRETSPPSSWPLSFVLCSSHLIVLYTLLRHY